MEEKKTKTLSFKVTGQFKEKLEQLAKEENRSLSNFVIKILTDYINKVDEAKKLLEKR